MEAFDARSHASWLLLASCRNNVVLSLHRRSKRASIVSDSMLYKLALSVRTAARREKRQGLQYGVPTVLMAQDLHRVFPVPECRCPRVPKRRDYVRTQTLGNGAQRVKAWQREASSHVQRG